MVIGLMVAGSSCGGSGKDSAKKVEMDTLRVSGADYIASIIYPKGFFTVSDDKEEFIAKNEKGPVLTGKDFSMQAYIIYNPYNDIAEWKKASIDQYTYIADIKGDGIEGFYRRPYDNKIMCLYDINAGVGKGNVVEVILVPNEQKNPTIEELNNSTCKHEFRVRCDKMMESQELHDILKTLKVEKIKKK